MRKTLTVLLAATTLAGASSAWAADAVHKTVAGIYQDRAKLAGQQVQVQGKVTRVNNGIMHRNFLHLQDGTGGDGTNQVTVTSQDTAQIGDKVVVTGTLAVNRDFGSGYTYPVIIEKASIAKVQ